jgi:hypothetical protein
MLRARGVFGPSSSDYLGDFKVITHLRTQMPLNHLLANDSVSNMPLLGMSIDVAHLVLGRRNLRIVLRPIFQPMRFYLREPQHYIHILRAFQPQVFPKFWAHLHDSARRVLPDWALF